MFRPSRARSVACLAAAGAVTASLVTTTVPSAAAAPAATPAAFFGIHDNVIGSAAAPWVNAPVGGVRLWDTGVTWRDIEPVEGLPPAQWNWAQLDAQVALAVAHKADPLIVLGGTPAWASDASAPAKAKAERAKLKLGTSAPMLGAHAADVPRTTAWDAYVSAVVNRYKTRGVHAYQVWNEPNVSGFFNGAPSQMAAMTVSAAGAIRGQDPKATVVAPSFVLRLPDAKRFFQAYANNRQKPLSATNVVSLNLYPLAKQTPEDSVALLAWAKTVLKKAKVSKPIWNTEINYGLSGGGQAQRTLSNADAGAYVARTYLLNKANGVSRVFWYSWSHATFFGINMTAPDNVTLTPAGKAYLTTRRWMSGTVLSGCKANKQKTYVCTIKAGKTTGLVYWNPTKARPVITTPAKTYQVEYVDGRVVKSAAKKKIKLSGAPILVRTKK